MLGTDSLQYQVDWEALTTGNIARTKELMDAHDVDAVLVGTIENFRYLSGLPTNYTFAYSVVNWALLTKNEDLPHLFALDYQKDAMERTARWHNPIAPLPFDGTREARQPMGAGVWPALIADVCRESGADKGVIALDPGIPYVIKDALASELPAASFVNACEILRDARLVKNEEELAAIRNACMIGDIGLRAGLKQVRVGSVEREVAGVIEQAMRSSGAENSLSVPFVLSGDHPLLGYAYPSDKTIRNGELTILDVGCAFGGYYSDLCRTVYLGHPTPEVERTYEAVEKAIDQAIEICRPGRTNIDVYDAMNETIRDMTSGEHQLGWFGGHAAGLGINEEPMIGSGEKVNSYTLEEGMYLCIEPGLHLPGIGLICIEEGVIVTADEPEVVTKSTRDLTRFR